MSQASNSQNVSPIDATNDSPLPRRSSLRRQSDQNNNSGVIPPRRLVHVTEDIAQSVELEQSAEFSPNRRQNRVGLVSFPTTPNNDAAAQAPAVYTPASRSRHLQALQNSVRSGRRAFFNAIGPSRSMFSLVVGRSCPIKCTGLASIAAAFSYMDFFAKHTVAAQANLETDMSRVNDDLDIRVPLPVTVDTLLETCALPFAWLGMNDLTVHQAHDICSALCENLNEFSNASVDLVTMDLRVTEFSTEHVVHDFDSAPRDLPMDAASLRTLLLDRQKDHDAVVIVFYDKNLIDDSVVPEDEDDLGGGDLCMNKSFMAAVLSPSSSAQDSLEMSQSIMTQRTQLHQTEAAVVVGVARSDKVQIAIPRFTENRSGMIVMEVSIATLHRAMAAVHPFSNRANGFVVVKRKRGAMSPVAMPAPMVTLNDRLAVGGDANGSAVPPPLEIHHREPTRTPRVSPRARSMYGNLISGCGLQSASHVQLPLIGFRVASHVTAIALAQALVQRTFVDGLNINGIVSQLKLPFEQASNCSVSVAQVGAMCKNIFPEPDFNVAILPLAQSLRRASAPCTVSTQDFCVALAALKKANATKVGAAVMLIQFNTAFVHWLVDSSPTAADAGHWCLIGEYDEKEEVVEIIETCTAKFGAHWKVDAEQLHRAMTNLGFVVVARSDVPLTPFMPPEEERSSIIDIAQQIKPHAPQPIDLFPSVGINVASGAPLSLVASALTHRGYSFSQAIQDAALPYCFLLDPRITLHDYAWCCREMLRACGATDARVHVDTFIFDIMAADETELRDRFEEIVHDAVQARGSIAVVFNYAVDSLSMASKIAKGPVHPIGFALLTGATEDTLYFIDAATPAASAKWSVSKLEMFDAVARACPLTKRPLGIVSVHMENAATPKAGRPSSVRHSLRVPADFGRANAASLLPLQPHLLPSLDAAAIALGIMGVRGVTGEHMLTRALRTFTGTEAERGEMHPTTIAIAANPTEPTHRVVSAFLRLASPEIQVSAITSDFKQTLDAIVSQDKQVAPAGDQIVVIYDATKLHGNTAHYLCGAAVVAEIVEYADGSSSVKLIDALPSVFGDSWTATAAELAIGSIGMIRLTKKGETEPQKATEE